MFLYLRGCLYVSFSVCVSFSFCIYVCVGVCMSSCFSDCLCVCLHVTLPFLSISFCVCDSLIFYICVGDTGCLYVILFFCLSVSLCVSFCVSVCDRRFPSYRFSTTECVTRPRTCVVCFKGAIAAPWSGVGEVFGVRRPGGGKAEGGRRRNDRRSGRPGLFHYCSERCRGLQERIERASTVAFRPLLVGHDWSSL